MLDIYCNIHITQKSFQKQKCVYPFMIYFTVIPDILIHLLLASLLQSTNKNSINTNNSSHLSVQPLEFRGGNHKTASASINDITFTLFHTAEN